MKYRIQERVSNIKHRVKAALFSLLAICLPVGFALASGGASATPAYTLTPWTFVGAFEDCGPLYPAGTPGNVVSMWDNTTGNPSPSLYLQKSAPTTDCSSAGATVNGVSGITLTQLSFDYKTGMYCGAGAPRFNVDASDGFHFAGGCANGTQTDLGNGWTHVTIDVTNPAQTFPVMTTGATLNSLDIVFDEQGSTNIDNIGINNQVIGGPNTPASKDACKKDGWKALQDSNGNAFKNQGQCVAWVEHNMLGHGN